MIEAVTKALIAGTLGSGLAMMASVVVPAATTPTGEAAATASPITQVAGSKPELAALLIALSMFLGFLTLLLKDRKEDRKEAKKQQDDCHNLTREREEKLAQLTTTALVKFEECAIDRDAMTKVVEENTKSNNQLRDAFRSNGGMGN